MTQLIYIDTNVYLDLLMNRHAGLMPSSEIARNIIERASKCEFHIIVSEVVIKELERFASNENIQGLFASLNTAQKLSLEFSTSDDRINARNLDETVPFPDRMHFAIAERCNAEYLVTNDRHFDKLKNKVKIIKPNLL